MQFDELVRLLVRKACERGQEEGNRAARARKRPLRFGWPAVGPLWTTWRHAPRGWVAEWPKSLVARPWGLLPPAGQHHEDQ